MKSTLVLKQTMEPHRIATWQEAICLVHLDKVDVLEEYEETVSSPSVTMVVPAVVKLRRAVRRRSKGIKFSRINVATRDDFTCQYCGRRFQLDELNYDHVNPRKNGGQTVWENIVMACYDCNHQKGHLTLEEAEARGLRLRKKPERPHYLPLAAPIIRGGARVPKEWLPYLQQMAAAG